MPEIAAPKIINCEEWTLTERLDFEKEVTGLFISGHPLDHFKFELKHYGIMALADFNEIKEAPQLQNPNRTYRMAGLVIDAQHRVTRTGRNFGSLVIEDFSGKTEMMLWSDDYMRFKDYLDKGKNVVVTGYFKQRFNSDQYEFKPNSINLLETLKQSLTAKLEFNLDAASLTGNFISFITENVKSNPGKATVRFNVIEPKENLKVSLYSYERGFTMNDDMANFLLENPDVEVSVGLVER